MGIADESIIGKGTPTATVEQARVYIRAQPDRLLTADEANEIAHAFWDIGPTLGIDPAKAFAMAAHETSIFRYGGDAKVEQRNIGGIGTTGGGVPGISNPTWRRAVEVFFWHLLAWTGDTILGAGTPRYQQVRAAIRAKGAATTWRSLGGRWAVTSGIPWQEQAAMPGNYGERIERHHAAIVAIGKEQPTMATGKEVTDRHIAGWRGRGIEVVDNRGNLPVNADHPYRAIALDAIRVIVDHWTGDRFSRAFIARVTGTDYGLDAISDRMTIEDEVDLVRWYANLHIGNDGRTWGGIAYPYMAFPSGRIHVNWDIGTLTYHAFSVNAYSVAVCAPNSNGQEPTPRQLVALNSIWWALCEETPEIPAGWSDLWGHAECKQFDPKNQTICPGPVYLRHVQRARQSKAPTVPIAATPVVDPGMPGVLQPDGTPLVGEVNFGGQLVTVERVIVQGKNAGGAQYNTEWDAHQVAGWIDGPIPLPRRVS